jgi:hypothetical protein
MCMGRQPVSRRLHKENIGREVWVRAIVWGGRATLDSSMEEFTVLIPGARDPQTRSKGVDVVVAAEDVRFEP